MGDGNGNSAALCCVSTTRLAGAKAVQPQGRGAGCTCTASAFIPSSEFCLQGRRLMRLWVGDEVCLTTPPELLGFEVAQL